VKGFRPKTPGEKGSLEQYSPKAESAMWHRFYRKALSRGRNWEGCQACPPERRDPKAKIEVDHVVSQQRIKRWCRERGIPKGSLRELELLTDDRNSMLLDEHCHAGKTLRMRPIPRDVIPGHAWEFIEELGLVDEILEEYPRREDL
jgi:hypothetical protein